VRDPADRRAIEHLIGRSAYALLAPHARRPTMRSLRHCLKVLDSLNVVRTTAPASAPRHWYSPLASDHPRRTRAR
jgi:tryptophan 2,3-dioxygenase